MMERYFCEARIMNQMDLFRKEALAHIKHQWHGVIFINVPVCYRIIATGYVVFTMALIVFLVMAEFSEQCNVTGYINVAQGMIQIYAKHQGVIVKSYVKQGMPVKRGDPLFLIDTSYDGLNQMQRDEMLMLLKRRQYVLQQAILVKREYLKKLKPLLQKRYISVNDYQIKHDEMLELIKQQNMLDVDMLRHQQSRAYVVRASRAGTISNIMAYEGQVAQMTQPLLSLLPHDATFIAELHVPVAKSGFLNVHDKVIIHYDAYPYQRYGVATGYIHSISQTALTDEDEHKLMPMAKPYYKVMVTLDKSAIAANGEQHILQQGMTLNASILGAKKKAWQWILEPLYQDVERH
jgi:membrane fusion protein